MNSVEAKPSAAPRKRRSPILLIVLLLVGVSAIGWVVKTIYLPGMLAEGGLASFAQTTPQAPPGSAGGLAAPPAGNGPAAIAGETLTFTPPPKPKIEAWSPPAEGTAKEIYEAFCRRFDKKLVQRILIRVTDGDPPPHLVDVLRARLPVLVRGATPPAIYVAQQGKTTVVIVAPTTNRGDYLFKDAKSNYDYTRGLLTTELTSAQIPPPPGSPAEAEYIAGLIKNISQTADVKLFYDSASQLEGLKSKTAADALLAHMVAVRGEGNYTMALDKPFESMGCFAEEALLKWMAEGKEKGNAVKSQMLDYLRVVGTEKSLEQLAPLVASPDRKLALAALDTLDEIKGLRELRRQEVDGETPAPPEFSGAAVGMSSHALYAFLQSSENQTKYAGQIAEAAGKVIAVGYAEDGRPFLHLRAKDMPMHDKPLVCYFAKGQTPWPEAAPERRVVLHGKVPAEGDPTLSECRVLKAEWPAPVRMQCDKLGKRATDVMESADLFQMRYNWYVLDGKVTAFDAASAQASFGPNCVVKLANQPPEVLAQVKPGAAVSILATFGDLDFTPAKITFAEGVVLPQK